MSATRTPPPGEVLDGTLAGPRAYSTRELQAAASALASGQFAASGVAGLTPAPPAARPRSRPLAETGTEMLAGLGPLVRVMPAHAGAGASTVALALADGADTAGLRTRVLDAATPAWSGLVGASSTELGALDGWRRGRRGKRVLIDRVEAPVTGPAAVPFPRALDGIDVTILDVGWSVRELNAPTPSARGWMSTAAAQLEVVVTRADRLALGQTEAVLAHLGAEVRERVAVVVVGVSRRSRPTFAGLGPCLQRAHENHTVHLVPPVKALGGIGPEPLPRQLIDSVRRLLDQIPTIPGPLADPANR